jgi:hypothetical protein
MQKDGSTQLLPRTALLIRGSKPDPRWVRTGAPDHQSQGRRGHAHPILSSSPPARGCPTCRVREPARAASRGDPTEGELSCPRSLANGTEPHLANPCKCFNGRVSGPRNLPLSNGAWASRLGGSTHAYTSWVAPSTDGTSCARVTEAGWNIADAGWNMYHSH